MYNIEVQSCGLFMLVIVLSLFIYEEKLDIIGRKLYYFALLSSVICLLMDIISVVGIVEADKGNFPIWAAKLICKLYVISLSVQAFQGFLYAAGEFFAAGSHKRLKIFYICWTAAGIVAIAALPIEYYCKDRIVYSFGPSTLATYVTVFFLIVSTLIMAFKGSDRTSHRRRRAILLWQTCWFIAATIQALRAELLLVGFAMAFGMVIIYAELENPHAGIDRITGLHTANALLDFVNDAFQHERSFSAIYIRIEPVSKNTDIETRRTILIRAANYLKQSAGYHLFRSSDNEIVVIIRNAGLVESEYEKIRQGMERAVGMPVKISYLVIPDNTVTVNPEEFFRLAGYHVSAMENQERITVDSEAVTRMREYVRTKDLLQSALDNGNVEVFYQPFYHVRENKYASAEALVRIRDNDGNIVPPARFIPVAEDNGMIVPLGIEIFRQVCEFAGTGVPGELGIDHIEVNLSLAQFDSENPAQFVIDNIEKYKIDPSLINLEITETASTIAKKTILKNMERLIDYGVNFALDDFGTGRSNLDYLAEMPVSIVKFDYTFTQRYFNNDKMRNIIENAVGLIHDLGLSIVSEGVETEEQLEAMKRLGVEYIQGYYFSKPLPQEEFVEFMKQQGKNA